MEQIAKSVAYARSTESLGEWAGQPSTLKPGENFNITDSTGDEIKTISSKEPSGGMARSTQLSTHYESTNTLETARHLQEPSRFPPRLDNTRLDTLHPKPTSTTAAQTPTLLYLSPATSQPQIPETMRMTKARRVPCCQWKHEDHKPRLHVAWLHHYTSSQ